MLGDHAAQRHPEQVEAVELQVVGQREHVLRHVRRRVVVRGERRLADVAVVEEHRLVPLGERLDLKRPGSAVAAETVDADERVTFAVDFVVDL